MRLKPGFIYLTDESGSLLIFLLTLHLKEFGTCMNYSVTTLTPHFKYNLILLFRSAL